MHKPSWFKDDQVFVSFAPTVGINKDGHDLFVIDALTGSRTSVIDDGIAKDVDALLEGQTTETSRWIDRSALTTRQTAVPVYFDERPLRELANLMKKPEFQDFDQVTLGDLIRKGTILAFPGHGSPSADMRTGDIPYIKVSDIRAGQVNINPTNRVSEVVARKYWRGFDSGLEPYDLISPIRTSKNIGDFAILMPGQQRVVLTKEMLVLRAGPTAEFDNFYLLWALTLKAVRRQWDRIVFMQTNREDVGKRYEEILIPVPPTKEKANRVAKSFAAYYRGVDGLRSQFIESLSADDLHHVFMNSAGIPQFGEDGEGAEDSLTVTEPGG